jgi:hypothetical protein
MDDRLIDELLGVIDEVARDFDNHDYGLPIGFEEPREKLRAAVREWYENHFRSASGT